MKLAYESIRFEGRATTAVSLDPEPGDLYYGSPGPVIGFVDRAPNSSGWWTARYGRAGLPISGRFRTRKEAAERLRVIYSTDPRNVLRLMVREITSAHGAVIQHYLDFRHRDGEPCNWCSASRSDV